jgi:adenylate kinase
MRFLPSLARLCRPGARWQSSDAAALSAELSSECAALAAQGGRLHWVFLGAPGVGKGTYASRVAKLMGVPHVSAGDLVRDEIKAATPLAKQARHCALTRALGL